MVFLRNSGRTAKKYATMRLLQDTYKESHPGLFKWRTDLEKCSQWETIAVKHDHRRTFEKQGRI